jgi:hypothetical protein
MNIPRELPRLYADGRLIPFVGAGVSMSVRWDAAGVEKRGLSWREMVDEAARMLGFVPPALLHTRGTDLQILEYFKLINEGIAPLTNWMFAEMRAPDDAIRDSPVLECLARLDACGVYYTTNYDDFLERALRLHGRDPITIATEAQMGQLGAGQPQIVKFHGDFNHPSQMVVTESDYERRLAFQSEMDLRLRADVLGRAVLFLGYSFRDANVAYLFRLVNEYFHALGTNPSGRRAYIVVADPSDFEIRLFRARNIEVIPANGGQITEDTAAILKALRSV